MSTQQPVGILITTDTGTQDTEFIRLSTPIEPPEGEFRFYYQGFHGCDSFCQIEIHQKPGQVVIIATEDNDNEGTSITNMAEHVATRVCHQFKINPDHLVWIEHYPQRGYRGDIPESWDIVQFEQIRHQDGTFRLKHPKWSPFTEKALAVLINPNREVQKEEE